MLDSITSTSLPNGCLRPKWNIRQKSTNNATSITDITPLFLFISASTTACCNSIQQSHSDERHTSDYMSLLVLHELCWLPVCQHIKFQLLITVYKWMTWHKQAKHTWQVTVYLFNLLPANNTGSLTNKNCTQRQRLRSLVSGVRRTNKVNARRPRSILG